MGSLLDSQKPIFIRPKRELLGNNSNKLYIENPRPYGHDPQPSPVWSGAHTPEHARRLSREVRTEPPLFCLCLKHTPRRGGMGLTGEALAFLRLRGVV